GGITGAMSAGGGGAALGGLLNDFAGHQERLGYTLRLRRGQGIGSGLVEGSIKQLVNRRLKQTGARWGASTWGRWWRWARGRPVPSDKPSGTATDRPPKSRGVPSGPEPLENPGTLAKIALRVRVITR